MRRRRFFPPAHEETDKGHGRIEIRRIVVASAEGIPTLEFPGVRQVFRIERQVWRGKDLKPSREVVYGLTSLRKEKAGPAQLLALNRGHWSVENKSHYVRDVTFGEDLSQHRCGNAPAVLASLRNTAISLIKLAGGISIAGALRTIGRDAEKALRAVGLDRRTP